MTSRLLGWWRQSLRQRPVLTNAIVYGSFYSAAEFSQQTFNKMYLPEKPDYDLAAAVRIVGIGSTVYPPIFYYWYRYLDKRFAGVTIRTVAIKVAADQFLMTPVLLAAFYTLMGILERKQDVFEELREKYWRTFMANQTFWIPGQTINFALVPPHLRVVYISCLSFVWINVLCYLKRQKMTTNIDSEKQIK